MTTISAQSETPAPDLGPTSALARYVAELDLDDVPTNASRYAELLTIDNLGCQVAGAALPWSERVWASESPFAASGSSTVMGRSPGFSSLSAAFVNSAFGHSNETDDTHLLSPTHPGSTIVPAVFAVAESEGMSGRRILESVLAGYEVSLRVSQAVSPYMFMRGHHPPAAVGPFGAAAAVAKLYGLDSEVIENALGIAGSFSAGLMKYSFSGGEAKRLHCAIGCQAGLRAAHFARHGLVGPKAILEDERGFCAVFAGEYNRATLTAGLGTSFRTLESSIKMYSCAHSIHAPLDVIHSLQDELAFVAEDVEAIVIYTRNPSMVPHVGTIVHPVDVLGAQFSMQFSIAMAIAGIGNDFWSYATLDLRNPVPHRLAERISYVLENPSEVDFPLDARIELTLKSGATHVRSVQHTRGTLAVPLTEREITDKFLVLTVPVLGKALAEDALARLDRLRELSSVEVQELQAIFRLAREP